MTTVLAKYTPSDLAPTTEKNRSLDIKKPAHYEAGFFIFPHKREVPDYSDRMR